MTQVMDDGLPWNAVRPISAITREMTKKHYYFLVYGYAILSNAPLVRQFNHEPTKYHSKTTWFKASYYGPTATPSVCVTCWDIDAGVLNTCLGMVITHFMFLPPPPTDIALN